MHINGVEGIEQAAAHQLLMFVSLMRCAPAGNNTAGSRQLEKQYNSQYHSLYHVITTLTVQTYLTAV